MFWKSKRIVKLENEVEDLKYYVWNHTTYDKCKFRSNPPVRHSGRGFSYYCESNSRKEVIQQCKRSSCPEIRFTVLST